MAEEQKQQIEGGVEEVQVQDRGLFDHFTKKDEEVVEQQVSSSDGEKKKKKGLQEKIKEQLTGYKEEKKEGEQVEVVTAVVEKDTTVPDSLRGVINSLWGSIMPPTHPQILSPYNPTGPQIGEGGRGEGIFGEDQGEAPHAKQETS